MFGKERLRLLGEECLKEKKLLHIGRQQEKRLSVFGFKPVVITCICGSGGYSYSQLVL